MRTLVILGVILLLFITSGVYVQHYITQTGKLMASEVSNLMKSAHVGDWTAASDHSKALAQRWDRYGQNWGFFTEHDEIDDINGTLSRLRASVREKDATGTITEGEAALHLFQHIPEKEALTLANIL